MVGNFPVAPEGSSRGGGFPLLQSLFPHEKFHVSVTELNICDIHSLAVALNSCPVHTNTSLSSESLKGPNSSSVNVAFLQAANGKKK